MFLYKKFLDKRVTTKLNKVIEMFIPPILADRKIVAATINGLQGRGFRFIDPRKNPAKFPRCKRESDFTPDQKNAIMNLIIGKRVLDIGCGNGILVKELALNGFKADGIDPQAAQDKGKNWQISNGSINDFKFSPNAFDTIISLKTLEHIPDAKSTLASWRVLSKFRIILLLPCQRYRKFVYDGHVNFYPDEYQLRSQLGLRDNAVVSKVNSEWIIYEDILLK